MQPASLRFSTFLWRRAVCLSGFLLLMSIPSWGQFYHEGLDRASSRWNQIHTDHYQIIFMQNREAEAQYLAHTLSQIDTVIGRTLLQSRRKIPIVLHSESMLSNGIVSWTPHRMEIYPTPSPTQDAQIWMNHLATHEYRHVMQMTRLESSIPRPLKWLFGEQIAGLSAAFIPKWYLEGDAVLTETTLSYDGRGRDPDFAQLMRAQILNGERFSYEKAYLGSYKDKVDNYYHLGYHLVSHLRTQTEAPIFGEQLSLLGRQIYRMGLGWKYTTGKRIREWHQEMTDTLKYVWQRQDAQIIPTSFSPLSLPQSNYTTYTSAQVLPDGSIAAIKETQDEVARIVHLLPNGEEALWHRAGVLNSDRLHYSNGKLVWSETIPSSRWENLSFSRIRLYDISSGKAQWITRHSTYFSPCLSPDASQIATVEASSDHRAHLVLLQTEDGKVLQRFTHPTAFQIQCPAWSFDTRSIYVIAIGTEGKSIERLWIASGTWEVVVKASHDNIRNLQETPTHLLFSSPRTGITNVFALDHASHQISQLTSARFGATQASLWDDSHIVYSNFSEKGYALVTAPLKWDATIQKNTDPALYQTAIAQENASEILPRLQSADTVNYPISRYRKGSHLFNIHSWAPFYIDYRTVDDSKLNTGIGASVASQDVLGKLIAYGGWRYNGSRHIASAGLQYYGLYPTIESWISYGEKNLVYQTFSLPAAYQPTTSEFSFNVRTYVRLDFSRNGFSTTLMPIVQARYNDGYYYSSETNAFERGAWEMIYGLSFARVTRTTERELEPRFGIKFAAQYTHAPVEKDNFGNIFFTRAYLYFPGLFPSHRFQIGGGLQRQHIKRFIYSSGLDFPRGYPDDYISYRLSTLKLDYQLPLFQPDWNLGMPLYIKRIYVDLFFDKAWNQTHRLMNDFWTVYTERYNTTLESIGADWYADIHLFRLYFPVTVGLRTAYLPVENNWKVQALFSISFQ